MSGDVPGGGGSTGPRRRGHLRAVTEVGPTVPELLETDALLDRLGRHESTAADLDDPVGRLLHGYAVFADPLTSGARPVEVELPSVEADAPAEAGPAGLPAPRVLLARRGALQTVGRGTAAACAVLGLFAGTAAAASTSTDALSTIGQRISASADAARPTVPGPILNFFAGSPEERLSKVVQRAAVSALAGNDEGATRQVEAVRDQLRAVQDDPTGYDLGRLSTDPTALDLLLGTVTVAAQELATQGEIRDDTVQATIALVPGATPGVTASATAGVTPSLAAPSTPDAAGTSTPPRSLTDLLTDGLGRTPSETGRPVPLLPETTSSGSSGSGSGPAVGDSPSPSTPRPGTPAPSTPSTPEPTSAPSSGATTTPPPSDPSTPTTGPTTGPTDQPTGGDPTGAPGGEPTDGGSSTAPTTVPTAQTAPPPSSPESSPETSPTPTPTPVESPVQFPVPFPTSFPTETPTTSPVVVAPVVEPVARPTDPPTGTDPTLAPIGTGEVPSPTEGAPVTPGAGLV